MRVIEKIREIIYIDSFVSEHRAEDEHRVQRGIALIASLAFAVMSLLNVKEGSYLMLATTAGSSICLLIGYSFCRNKNRCALLKSIFYIIFIVVFTAYTVLGGNEGFASLWLITATYAVMIAIDFKAGFLISLYYLLVLLLVFVGPLSGVLQYAYNPTFLLRFPFLYAINFAFATYIVVCSRRYQYDLFLKQKELERLSSLDLSTGLQNRNHFIQYEQGFSGTALSSLSAVFIDVNGLHQINNRDGHDAGDRMLCAVADLCKAHFSDSAVYRMGGDEFLIISENLGEHTVKAAAKALYGAVQQAGYSISYGVETQVGDFDLNTLVKNADEKMILHKKAYYQSADARR